MVVVSFNCPAWLVDRIADTADKMRISQSAYAVQLLQKGLGLDAEFQKSQEELDRRIKVLADATELIKSS
jgi:hypothetical protein